MKVIAIAWLLFGALLAGQTGNPTKTTGNVPRKAKPLTPPKPECAKGAICFSGAVSRASGFTWPISPDLDFVLEPGWTITVVPHRAEMGCGSDDLSALVTFPISEHSARHIDENYGWTAEQEVDDTPREFSFLTNCSDSRTAYDLYIKGDAEKLLAFPHVTGRLWITNSKISHAHDTDDNKSGEIESMEFSVEIVLPAAK